MIKIGAILAGFLSLSTIQSTYFFLVREKLGLVKWFFFNACAPINIFFLLGFLIFFFFKKTTLIYAATLPVFVFALWGLVLFSWENPFSQLGHIIMLLNVLGVVFITFQTKDYKSIIIGLLLGVLLTLVFIGFQQNYLKGNWEEFKRVMPLRLK